VVLVGSVVFLVAAVHDDPRSAVRAVVLLGVAAPVYVWMRWRQRRMDAA
jgi:Flp pilus assembly protein TadB